MAGPRQRRPARRCRRLLLPRMRPTRLGQARRRTLRVLRPRNAKIISSSIPAGEHNHRRASRAIANGKSSPQSRQLRLRPAAEQHRPRNGWTSTAACCSAPPTRPHATATPTRTHTITVPPTDHDSRPTSPCCNTKTTTTPVNFSQDVIRLNYVRFNLSTHDFHPPCPPQITGSVSDSTRYTTPHLQHNDHHHPAHPTPMISSV